MARRTRGRMSRIEQLPPEIKDRVDELLRGGVPQAEILRRLEEPLREIGEQPLSAGGLNRYATRMEEIGAELRETRAIAEAWRSKFGDKPTSELGQLTVEVLSTLAFKAALRARSDSDDPEAVIDPTMLNDLALAQLRLERAAEVGTRRERDRMEAFAKRAADQAVESAKRVAKEAGNALPPEALQRIRRDVYGIHDA